MTKSINIERQKRAGDAGETVMSAMRVQPRLEVGRVDDPAEVEADNMAAHVMSILQRSATDDAPVAPGGTRIRRRPTTDDLGGTAVPADVESSIQSAGGGRALAEPIRRKMEGAFGAVFSGVRTHDNSNDAVALQAEAFTLGNDIHFAPGRFDPESSGGQELLAHELTHVVQQSGGLAARRRIQRRLWNQKTFDEKTSEGVFAQKSLMQEEVRKVVDQYWGFYSGSPTSPEAIPHALSLIGQMREMAIAWQKSHTADSGEIDADRSNRMVGVVEFLAHLAIEEAELTKRYIASQKADPKGDPEAAKAALGQKVAASMSDADLARTQKVTDHYEGTGPSTFRRLGTLFDLAAPQDGDSTKIELEAYVPVDPTGTAKLGLHFVSEVERDDGKVKMKTELGVSVKGSIANAASISAELGGYIEVQAATGADAAELISYDLYRRARESKIFPSEMTDYMWGGRGGNAGKRAEIWSKALEKRVWGTLDDMPKRAAYEAGDAGEAAFDAAMEAWIESANEVYVESGGYAAVKAGGNAGLAALEGALTAHAGRRIDFTSLKNRKGGAGEDNLKSDSVFNLGNAQKGVGRTVAGIAAELKASAGPFEASGKLVGRKISGGERATKGEAETWSSDWEVEVEAIGKVPMAQMLSAGPGKYIALLAASLKKFATQQTQKEATGAQNAGAVLSIGENLGYLLTQLANVPEEEWKPDFGPQPEDAEGAFKAEGNIGLKIKFSAEPGTMKVGLYLVKDASVEAVGMFKAAIEKSERLKQMIITGSAQ